MNALEQRIQECERAARRSGKSQREVALKRVNLWKQVLQEVSDDYRQLDEEEFEQLLEKEIDSLREHDD
ncbi:hypothetical protein JMJ58_03625 [Haloterrigena salifodinae]|uniref:Uncharacterized protein n=1 Tax=Haloterrigena salifodinae TaxID=2675099 RepID=A0A8T8E2L6_9EURY|nr:hypothetical protein [Haloterrigena salifodinae]QRV15998.1 hypothetical protein JMJ58_03625 [Haloterrigena salifodinae]